MSSRWKNGELIATGLLLLFILAAPAISQVPGPPKRGAVGRKAVQTPVPDFNLTDQDERLFRSGSLQGKVALVSFIYTTCADVCPLLTAKFAGIQRKLKSQGLNDYFLLSITTDPEADTPKVLRSYGQRFGADFRSWAFLTGDKRELSDAWRFFGVRVNKRGKALTDHTGLTTLIDRQGIRRIDYYGDSWTEKEVLKDIAELMEGKHHVEGMHGQMRQANGAASKTDLKPAEGAGVTILTPKPGQVFKGDQVPVHFKFFKGKRGHHLHVYVDGELTGMFEGEKGTLTGIEPGKHLLEVRMAVDHQTELDAIDRVNFVVK
ncbi:MAG TPA: SCO family protein [Candidatus Binatia bacterium]|jgi:protein SCO1/2